MFKRYDEFIEDIKSKYDALKKWREEHPNVIGKVWNPFSYHGINVYTDVKEFESPYCHVVEYDYTALGEKYAKWIKDTQARLLSEKTPSERYFSTIIHQSNTRVIEQPYFKIDDKGYFLDFFLPEYGLAFELNGKVHKGMDNEGYDIARDYAFHSIGIRTIRLSNLDIKCKGIKEKINEWANEALNGNFDPSLYYKRPNANKFDGKDTLFQSLHKRLNKILSKQRYCNKTILIETNHTYLCKVLESVRYDVSYLANKELVSEFFDIIEKNNISVFTRFIGNMNNMRNDYLNDWLSHNNQAVARRIDKVIRIVDDKISGNLRCESNDYKILRYKIVKKSNGEECFLPGCRCVYKMYVPCRKIKKNKVKYRAVCIYIGSMPCSVCEYCCGVDREEGVVKCKGYLNKDSKNIFDHFVKNEFCTEKEKVFYKEMVEVKKSESYTKMMKSIEQQNKQKAEANNNN